MWKKLITILLLATLVTVSVSCGSGLTQTQELANGLENNDRLEIVYFKDFEGYNEWVTIFRDKETGAEILVTDSGVAKLN